MARLALALVSLQCLTSFAYDAIGGYMPVSNVLEHSQINLDVALFNEALSGETPNYDLAKAIYVHGGGHSCKSSTQPRTLQGFATKDLTGESFADAFYNSGLGLSTGFFDTEILAALEGTSPYAALSDVKRTNSAKKLVQAVVTLYASHELEAAIQKAAADGPSDSGSGHAWDEGWAFYYGTDGTSSPWEVAKKRDENFPGATQVQTAILPYFSSGLVAVREGTYDDAAAKEARDTIYKMWAITYLRAAFKYLEISERQYVEKAHAEGYAYYMAIDGWIASQDASAAETMRNALAITQTQTDIASGTYCAAKAAMEAAYATLGIDCDMVGTWTHDEYSIINCASACSAPDATFPSGGQAVAAVPGSNAADVSCTPDEISTSPEPWPLGDEEMCEFGCYDEEDEACNELETEQECNDVYAHTLWAALCECQQGQASDDTATAAPSAGLAGFLLSMFMQALSA